MNETIKQAIIRKLTSRKFWVAVCTFVTSIIMACNGGEQTAQVVSGIIMAGASMIAYIVAEGINDFNNNGVV